MYEVEIDKVVTQYLKFEGITGDEEERKSATIFYRGEVNQALRSYPAAVKAEGVKVVHCARCGLPLRYRSTSYFEGYHLDTCI